MAAGTPGNTLLLNPKTWDLLLDASGDIALATSAYALAQDAASAIRLYLGEAYYNTAAGQPWLRNTLGQFPPLQLVRSQAIAAALTIPGVASAQCFIQSIADRTVTGQVQITTSTGQTATASFTA